MKFVARHKRNFLYGASMAILLVLLKWLELHFIIINHSFEIYIGTIAIIFTVLGIWLALKLSMPRVHLIEKEVYINSDVFILNEAALAKLSLSKRELEVLQLMARGLSNQEIASHLFVSLNTIKTHASNIFLKMDVKRRTQAIDKAKSLSIIP